MLSQLIDRIVQLAPASQKAIVTPLEYDPRKVLIDKGDKYEIVDAAPPLRQHEVLTLADLIGFASRPEAKKPVVWHNPSQVLLVLDDDDRRELVNLDLELTPQFDALANLKEKPVPHSQQMSCIFQPKQLSNFIKLQLAGCDFPTTVLEGLRKLKWTSSQTLRQEMGHGRESVGKDVEAELTASIELPESVAVKVLVYNNVGEEVQWIINCILDPRPFDQNIAFMPVPGELDDAIQQAQADIRQRLLAGLPNGTAVFAGRP